MLKNITITPDISVMDFKPLIHEYEKMLSSVLIAMLDRFERNVGYPFIDTKLDLITGKNFYPLTLDSPPYKDKNIIYSWIQGRGLEALAGHLEWIESSDYFSSIEKELLLARIKVIMTKVLAANERIRVANHGRMFFCTTSNGIKLEINEKGAFERVSRISAQSNFSDLFYSKGLFKATWVLGQDKLFSDGVSYFQNVVEDIINNNFHSDQQSFDPKNKVKRVPGKISQGPLMICLSGLAEIGKITSEEMWFDYAEIIISRIVEFHINHGQHKDLELYDFIEVIDIYGNPWLDDDDTILCDPGHALEFIGLATKCLLLMQEHSKYQELISKCKNLFPKVLTHVFKLGFNEENGGICKAYDLKGRKILNSDMPWWSLPETMRAAIELLGLDPLTPNINKLAMIAAKCSNAFVTKYINYDVHMMAYQTRDGSGEVIETIPATPDADPGYHTGLSIIDCIAILRRYYPLDYSKLII